MNTVTRKAALVLTAAATLATGAAAPAFAATTTSFAGGHSTGELRASAPTKTATCKTPSKVATDYLCNFKLKENFAKAGGHHGIITGAIVLDSTHLVTGHCFAATGSVTITVKDHLGTVLGTLQATLASTSKVCATTTASVHSFAFNDTVTGGTAAYAKATGTLTQTGTLTDRTTDPYGKVYAEAGSLTGSVSTP